MHLKNWVVRSFNRMQTADEKSDAGADHVKSLWPENRATYVLHWKQIKKVQKIFEQIFKGFRSSDYFLQLESMKAESLVIADQQSCGEYVLELCTHCPSRSGRCLASSQRCGLCMLMYRFAARRKLGANWNEVVTRQLYGNVQLENEIRL